MGGIGPSINQSHGQLFTTVIKKPPPTLRSVKMSTAMPIHMERDEAGNVVIKPVTGWEAWNMSGALLLIIEYVEKREISAGVQAEIETVDKHQIQLGLTPRQCLELSGLLKRSANNLLAHGPPGNLPN